MDERSAGFLFRHKVIRLLRDVGLHSDERIELLLSWRHRPDTEIDTVALGHISSKSNCSLLRW